MPGFGVLSHFARRRLDFVSECARDYGDVVRYHVGPLALYQLNHPALIEEVLVTRQRDYSKDLFTRGLSAILGQGLVTNSGASWRRQRKLAAPSFQRRHIAAYADRMVASAESFLRTRALNGRCDAHAEMMALSLDVVVRTLFAGQVGDEAARVGHLIEVLVRQYDQDRNSLRLLIPRVVPTLGRVRAHRALQELDRILDALIQARRRWRGDGDDLLGRLIAARDEDGQPMSDRQLRDEVATLYIAGHETTALTLFYSLYLLARHPGEQEALWRELDEVLGEAPVTLQHLPKLRRVKAVVQESMRLYPPAWTVGREPLRHVFLAGVSVPKGAQILLPQWVLHRDGRWFEEPLSFRPERWLDGLEQRLPRFAYFPFGGGPRVCVGGHFAMMESVLLLAVLSRALRLGPAKGETLKIAPSVTLRPIAGTRLEFRRR